MVSYVMEKKLSSDWLKKHPIRAQNQVSGCLLAYANIVLLAKDKVRSFNKHGFHCKHGDKLDKKFQRNKGVLYC